MKNKINYLKLFKIWKLKLKIKLITKFNQYKIVINKMRISKNY